MTDTTATPSLKPAEQNPWYLLATLYGVPEWDNEELQVKNRVAWNRYYAGQWTDEDREQLKGRVDPAELRPFDKGDLEGIRQQFQIRAGTDQIEMPSSDELWIDFGKCKFDKIVLFEGYVFWQTTFSGANFFRRANFRGAHFLGNADFDGTIVSGDADFTNATFLQDAYFTNATFLQNANFTNATFSGEAHFDCTKVSGAANFTTATFLWEADFGDAVVSGNAVFVRVTFSRYAYFSGATFSAYADFSEAKFSMGAIFSNAIFSGHAYFSSAVFSGYADFTSATFLQNADFTSTTFSGDADFSRAKFHRDAFFINTEFKSPTNFEDSRFLKSPPRFHGAKLHEGTVWRGVKPWPRVPADPTKVGPFIDAYERLKLEMDRLKKHEDELMFFAEELKCRRVKGGQLGGWPIGAYGVLCNYGQCYMLPLGWLLAVILVGAVQFWPALKGDFLLSLALSTANTLAALGLRKELISPETLSKLPHWLRFFSGVQMVIGPILLFLIGLGLRNRFRLK